MVIVSLSSTAPFCTTISKRYDAGLWATVGVHENTPVCESIVAPVGGFCSNLNSKSSSVESVTDAVKERVSSSITVLLPIFFNSKVKVGRILTIVPSY